jgi:hypothetical protein
MYLPLSAQLLLPISRSHRTFLQIAFVYKPRDTENGHMNQMHLTVPRTEQNYFHARFLRAPLFVMSAAIIVSLLIQQSMFIYLIT